MIVGLLLVVLFTLVVLLVVVQRQSSSRSAAASPIRQEQNFDPDHSTLVLPATSSRAAQQLQALRNSLSRMQMQRRRRTSRFQQEQSYDPARSQMVPRSDARSSEQPERRHPRVEDAEYVFHRVDVGPSQLHEASCRPQLGSGTSQAGRADTEASQSPAAPPRPDRLVDLPVALLRSRGSVDGASCAAARGGSPFADPKTAAAATKALLDQQAAAAMCMLESDETMASTVCAAEGAKSVQGEEEMEDEEGEIEGEEEAMEEVGPPYPAELVFVIV